MADIAHSVGALLWVDMAHVAGLVAAGLHPSPFPHADLVTTTTHKTLRGGRGGLIFSRKDLPSTADPADYPMVKPNLAATIDRSVFPGVQGGPLDARHRGQGGRPQAGPDGRVPALPGRRSWPTPGSSPRRWPTQGVRLVSGGTDNHLMLVDVTPLGVTGKEAEHLLDEIGITVNKNAHPVRHEPAQHRVRHPDRYAGHDDPRLR